MSIFVDEKLLKVPSDVILMVGLVVEFVRRLEFFPYGGAAAFEKCINRVLVFPVHVGFSKHLEIWDEAIARPDMVQHCKNLACICSRLLS